MTEFQPEENVVVTAAGERVKYDYLIVALGLQVNFDHVMVAADIGLFTIRLGRD